MPAEVGQPAPDFTLYDADRERRSLGEFQGSKIVLAFMPAAFSGGCTKEVCAFRDRFDRLRELDAQVIGITVDHPFTLKAWAEEHGLDFPLLSDFDRQVVNLYGVPLPNLAGVEGYVAARRAIFIVDREGAVRYQWVAEPGEGPPYDEIEAKLAELD